MKFKIDRTIITLLVAIGYALALPRVPWLADRALTATVILVVALGSWAMVERAWVDAWIGVSIALTFSGAKVLFGGADDLLLVLITAAILAFIYLNFTLLIGPWSRFFRPRFVRLMKHRRHIGVTTLLLAYLHVSIVMAAYYNSSLPLALQIPPNVFGVTALNILMMMGLTSWNFATGKITLRWWNIIHTGGLFGYLGLLAYVWNSAGLSGWEQATLVVIALYWLWLSPWRVQRFSGRAPNGWRQLHLLVYAAYASVITHVWTGVVSQRPLFIKIIFWLPVAVVVGSHAVGRALKIRQQQARRLATLLPADTPPTRLDAPTN